MFTCYLLIIMLTLSIRGNTHLCGYRFEPARYIIIHAVPMNHSFKIFLHKYIHVPLEAG